jgi:maleamate amidohydrolase
MSELDIYASQGFAGRAGFGKKSALVIVDFVNGFTDPAQFGGGNILDAVHRTVEVLAFFRASNLPVAHTRVVYAEDGSDKGVFCRKAPALAQLTEHAAGSQIVPALTPRAGELVVRKQGASAFFGTSLEGWLRFQGADTVVIAGCTTSGCVRATVVDAMQHNFFTVVMRDCVGDRAMAPHEANLFDMQQKYADVMDAAQVMAALKPS